MSTATPTFDFTGKVIKEIPAGLGKAFNTQKLPFPWDDYAAANEHREVPVPAAFWKTRGYEDEKITAKLCRERIQRAFYAWKKPADPALVEARKNYSIGIADHFDGKGEARKYTGMSFYFTVNAPAGTARIKTVKKAAEKT